MAFRIMVSSNTCRKKTLGPKYMQTDRIATIMDDTPVLLRIQIEDMGYWGSPRTATTNLRNYIFLVYWRVLSMNLNKEGLKQRKSRSFYPKQTILWNVKYIVLIYYVPKFYTIKAKYNSI